MIPSAWWAKFFCLILIAVALADVLRAVVLLAVGVLFAVVLLALRISSKESPGWVSAARAKQRSQRS